MAFTYLQTRKLKVGSTKLVWGTFTNTDGDTGGDIVLPMTEVQSFDLQHSGGTVVATEPAVNETLPLKNGGTVTIVTTANSSGWYCAMGK